MLKGKPFTVNGSLKTSSNLKVRLTASSACVERMFSIAGHIFTLKRRRLGIQVFMDLVWLKLNEAFY